MNQSTRTRGRPLLAAATLSAAALAAALLVAPMSGASLRPAKRTPGVSKHQIVLGTTTPKTGPAAPGYDEIAPAVNAVFSYVNAHGGVYGRKLKYIIENDQYSPNLTVQYTHTLVQSDHIFADVGPLGTPTQTAVQSYLNKRHVPQVFIESGCACWSKPKKFPYSFGWQPNYVVEGKILGAFIKKRYANKRVGYLYQNDEFGGDGVKGLNREIPKSHVVGKQSYDATSQGISSIGNQIAALQADGANLVVLYTIPAATAVALLSAAQLNYHPQWVVSSVGADPPTLAGLLKAYSNGAAGASLLNGMVTNAYLPPETDGSNAWNKLAKKIINKYDNFSKAWDGNSEYGVALGITTVEALEKAGKDLTRKSFINAIETQGAKLSNPGLVPLTYSAKSHYGFSGSEVVKIENSGKKISVLTAREMTTNFGKITVYKGKANRVPAQFKK